MLEDSGELEVSEGEDNDFVEGVARCHFEEDDTSLELSLDVDGAQHLYFN